ncbi:MAG: hypothetical protein ABSH06_14310 [Thermodesulfobacteriota bacterium]|jgi:hypothetical protein
MSDPVTISALLTSLSFAAKFVKDSLEKIKDLAVRKKVEELLNAIIPLQSHIIALQEGNFTCIKEKQNLENKLREIEDWAKEVSGYKLKALVPCVFVYVKKSESDDARPAVYFCPKCFDIHHKKSMLRLTSQGHDWTYFNCLNCKSDIKIRTRLALE